MKPQDDLEIKNFYKMKFVKFININKLSVKELLEYKKHLKVKKLADIHRLKHEYISMLGCIDLRLKELEEILIQDIKRSEKLRLDCELPEYNYFIN